jgi:Putative MetA-pathway of phenol degradation
MSFTRLLRVICLASGLSRCLAAQDLTPRAYMITPTGSNAIILSFGYNSGGILLDPTIPITDLTAQFQTPVVSLYHSFGFLSRSANVAVSVPYGYGHFQGSVLGNDTRISRSGLADTRVRLSVNLHGGPVMTLPKFAKYRERTVIGASITMVMPTGQFDPARLINPGANRWAFKPEVGFARRLGKWALDAYGGVWLFNTNSQFYPGTSVRKQNPIGSLEFHLGYYFRPRLWTSFDCNFWSGGSTVLNGVSNQDGARNSRVGGTVAVPLTRHSSFKFTANRGAIVRVGGNFTTLTAAWQYSWFTKPK